MCVFPSVLFPAVLLLFSFSQLISFQKEFSSLLLFPPLCTLTTLALLFPSPHVFSSYKTNFFGQQPEYTQN